MPSLPQDFPPHLDHSVEVEPVWGAPPLGIHPLPFRDMNWKQFEQFCWWVVERDYEIKGCQLIGGTGRSQGGIDLFATSRDKDGLHVFECKCWQEYDAHSLRDSVDRFLSQSWAQSGCHFVLIIAQPEIGKLAVEWRATQQKLKALGIGSDLWTGLHLTERIRLHPDILVRFFPHATVSLYCNEWMRRVNFMDQLQKALVDDRPSVRKLAQDFVDQGTGDDSQDIQLERVDGDETHWSFNGHWIQITALLPRKRSSSGSAAIVVKKQNTSGLAIALSQEWLLKNLLSHPQAPADHSYRPFIIGPVSNTPDSEVTIDINSARLQISPDGVHAMCKALDQLTPIYIDALRRLERRWEAEGFPVTHRSSDTAVVLCSIPSRLWRNILEFANAHEAGAGDTEWHIFDFNRLYLKVFTNKQHADFEPGYHAFIHAHNESRDSNNSDVVLTWTPPDSFESFEIAPRRWMSCTQTFHWLCQKLMPAVGDWLINKEIRSYKPWQLKPSRKSLLEIWKTHHVRVWERRQYPLLEGERYRSIGLVATTETLQSSMMDSSPRFYITSDETRKLYRALILVIKGNRGYLSYIASKLILDDRFNSRIELIDALERYIKDGPAIPSAYIVRNLLSALLEGLDDDASWLCKTDTEEIYSALIPLMKHFDIQQLVERHLRWNLD